MVLLPQIDIDRKPYISEAACRSKKLFAILVVEIFDGNFSRVRCGFRYDWDVSLKRGGVESSTENNCPASKIMNARGIER